MIAQVQFATTARTAIVSTVRTRAMPDRDDDDDDGALRIAMQAGHIAAICERAMRRRRARVRSIAHRLRARDAARD